MRADIATNRLLREDAEITGVIGSHIYPVVIPQGTTADAITYMLLPDVNHDTKDSYNDYKEAKVLINVYTSKYKTGAELIEKIHTRFDRYTGVIGGKVYVESCFYVDSEDVGFDDHIMKFQKAISFKLFLKPMVHYTAVEGGQDSEGNFGMDSDGNFMQAN